MTHETFRAKTPKMFIIAEKTFEICEISQILRVVFPVWFEFKLFIYR